MSDQIKTILDLAADGKHTEVKDQGLLTGLGNEQLNAAKQRAFQMASELLGDTGSEVPESNQLKAQNLLAACDGLETELQRRREIDGLRGKAQKGIASLMQPAALPFGDPATGRGQRKAQSLGEMMVESDWYKQGIKSGAFRTEEGTKLHGPGVMTVPMFKALQQGRAQQQKSLLYTGSSVGGAFVIPEYEMDWEPASRPGPDILDLLTVQPTNTDTIYWIRQDTRSTNATAVAEATALTGTPGAKPESALAFSRQTTPVETIAVWIPATNQQLQDAPELRRIIDDELTYDLTLELDNQILNGSGTSPDIDGILNASIQSVAYVASTHGNTANALFRAMTVIATANEPAPTGIVLNPLDWEPIRLLRESGEGLTATGKYLMGDPSQSGAMTLWGLPVVVSNRITANTGLVGHFPSARLHMREDSTIKVGMANEDFIRNIVRVLAEMRAALTVRRPNAFAKVTSI